MQTRLIINHGLKADSHYVGLSLTVYLFHAILSQIEMTQSNSSYQVQVQQY
jgi:hypothetical protein